LANHQGYQKTILLLDDDKEFARPVVRWLKKAGYVVSLAVTLGEALQCLEKERYHLAIVDVRLDDKDESNEGGMEFLHMRDERELREILPVIVLTGNATTDNVLEAFTEYNVFSYLKKEPGYRVKLLHEVERAFREEIQINFNLNYDVQSDGALREVVKDIYWSDRPVVNPGLLASDVQDIFGKLFKNAESIYITMLKPGLSGAGLMQVDPTWAGGRPGPARVVKVDRRDKSLLEKNNYETYVKNVMPHATTQVSYEYTQFLGAAQYTFAEVGSIAFNEFDEFYRKSTLKAIENSLHDLIFNTCRFWYDPSTRKRANLQNLYYEAFNLDMAKLVMRINEILPGFDPKNPTLAFEEDNSEVINPLFWLNSHERECTLSVKMCVTHGDMTGRNIMVDQTGRCWMIDFLRTYESHSLRDFVILETDLKYRQIPELPDQEYLELEKNLIRHGLHHTVPRPSPDWKDETKKLFSVVMLVRNLARQVAFGVANPSQSDYEYLVSLLMATLNVVRLRHISHARKMQALKAASMICEALED